jgi:hypothetical protein
MLELDLHTLPAPVMQTTEPGRPVPGSLSVQTNSVNIGLRCLSGKRA